MLLSLSLAYSEVNLKILLGQFVSFLSELERKDDFQSGPCAKSPWSLTVSSRRKGLSRTPLNVSKLRRPICRITESIIRLARCSKSVKQFLCHENLQTKIYVSENMIVCKNKSCNNYQSSWVVCFNATKYVAPKANDSQEAKDVLNLNRKGTMPQISKNRTVQNWHV